jgi:hypothetical protein
MIKSKSFEMVVDVFFNLGSYLYLLAKLEEVENLTEDQGRWE